jgi:hypothetical protein
MTRIEHLIWLFAIAVMGGIFLGQLQGTTVGEYEHAQADGIHGPRLQAAMNEFWSQHPLDRPGEQYKWEHVRAVSRGDMERFKAVEQAWKTWHGAMKRAGY